MHKAKLPPAATLPASAARPITAAALAVDAFIHAKLADQYDAVAASISQGALFRTEAALASLAALVVLVWRRPFVDVFAWLVAAGGLAALLLYRYVDVGAHGPLPDMYEPVWFGDKQISALAQGVAIISAGCLLIAVRYRRTSAVAA
ncbi:hypothetical protein GA0115240_16538 [Streptomyces sp. DvalAA-14]|uniref:hypothetical protein n=1 Tax=unclassified Streptomyces TaxID=2593676 RepID=UPI00081B7EF7|nr:MULTISPECIES: hypothetical protein [unclassified Streptomyces]MYS24540.1 hypothetical protein [Streptomyces sp. SID4948]SCE47043.1 hypothetical protein GA0115240_16538 [Streptomyces sp. DvalAA-14]